METASEMDALYPVIDADYLVYTMGYASERKNVFLDGTQSHLPDLEQAKRLILAKLKRLLNLFGVSSPEDTDQYTLVLSGKRNWRYQFYKEYKSNRADIVKPLNYKELREWLTGEDFPNCVLTGVNDDDEADDYCASLLTGNPPLAIPPSVAISADKDFFTIPGYFYHISSRRLYKPSVAQSLCFLFFQGLAGDRVDGYYGVGWVGKAKAQRLLVAAASKNLSVRGAYLFLKRQVAEKRGREAWAEFRLSLDLASLRWHNEIGNRGIGLRRVFAHRSEPFSYYLPYYDVSHNAEYGLDPYNQPTGAIDFDAY